MGFLASLRHSLGHEIKTIRGVIYRRISADKENELALVNAFHQLYFDARAFNMTWRNTSWMGQPILKCPLDLWLYQEMIHRLRPDVIVETGTAFGASAHFLAHMMDIVGTGRVITVDVEHRPNRPEHARITYLTGSSVAPEIVAQVHDLVGRAETVLVLLDSDHSRDHVRAELDAYHGLVTRGSYLVVEDTNLNGHPVDPEYGPGPMEALQDFLGTNPQFAHDSAMDKFFLTFNPGGYLLRS